MPRGKRGNLRQIQIAPVQTPVVASVRTNSPAALTGIQPNDVVVSVNGSPIFHPAALSDAVDASEGQALSIRC